MRSRFLPIALLSLPALALVACKTTEPAPTSKPAPASAAAATAKVAPPPGHAEKANDAAAQIPQLRPLYFDFNAHVLDEPSQQHLGVVAAYLRSSPGTTVVIAGHADERGTSEYNLALGDARARAARDYLVRLGVQPSQIRIQSYGEERPAEASHTEEAWARNRRDELSFGG